MGAFKVRNIAILALPGVQLLDVCGPLDVFAEANAQLGTRVYNLSIIGTGTHSGAIRSSSGVKLVADQSIADGINEIHTLLVAGCPDMSERFFDDNLIDWLKATVPRVKRFGSVCSGALLLAYAGLLRGKRVTTHWAVVEKLRERFPNVVIEPDALHVRDGKLRTAAGVTAGLDLAVSLIEEDFGRELAMSVANQLVMYFKRPGGQMQFSRKGEAQVAGRSALQEVQRYVAAHPAEEHTVAKLAERLGLSERHFARLFTHEVGISPASWVEEVRIDAARRMLEDDLTPKQVATQCGFADPDTLRRAFVRHVGVTPAEYRKTFHR